VTTIPVPDVSRATIEDEACSIGSAGSLVKRNQPSSTMSWDEFQNSDGNTKSNMSIVVYITVNNTNYSYEDKIHKYIIIVWVTSRKIKKTTADVRVVYTSVWLIIDEIVTFF